MRITQFGSITLPAADGNQSIPTDGRVNIVDLRYGGIDLDGNNLITNPTILQHNAVITENIQTNLQALTKELSKGRLLVRAKEIDNTQYQTFGKLQQFTLIPDAAKYGCEQAIQVGFTQTLPFWFLSSEEPEYLDDGWILDNGLSLDSGNKTNITVNGIGSGVQSGSTTINNTGGATIRKGYFVFNFTGDTAYDVDWIEIRNITNGLKWRFEKNITGTGTTRDFTTDWLSKTFLTNESELDHSDIIIPKTQMDWFRLELGNNSIEVDYYTNSTTDLDLDIYHSQHWLY